MFSSASRMRDLYNLYVAWLQDFRSEDKSVFKIGITSDLVKCLSCLPSGSMIIYTVPTYIPLIDESACITTLGEHDEVQHRLDLGREFFEGRFDIIKEIVGTFGEYKFEAPRKRLFKNDVSPTTIS